VIDYLQLQLFSNGGDWNLSMGSSAISLYAGQISFNAGSHKPSTKAVYPRHTCLNERSFSIMFASCSIQWAFYRKVEEFTE